MLRQIGLFSLLLSAACSSTADIQAESPAKQSTAKSVAIDPAAPRFPAKVRVIGTVVGESSRVTLGQEAESKKHHPIFASSPNLMHLMAVPDKSVIFATAPGLDECFAEAQQFVTDELPGWTIQKSEGAFTGHCWRGGVWVPCNLGTDPFEAYEFPLHDGSAPSAYDWTRYLEPPTATSPSGIERQAKMLFYVVVHTAAP